MSSKSETGRAERFSLRLALRQAMLVLMAGPAASEEERRNAIAQAAKALETSK